MSCGCCLAADSDACRRRTNAARFARAATPQAIGRDAWAGKKWARKKAVGWRRERAATATFRAARNSRARRARRHVGHVRRDQRALRARHAGRTCGKEEPFLKRRDPMRGILALLGGHTPPAADRRPKCPQPPAPNAAPSSRDSLAGRWQMGGRFPLGPAHARPPKSRPGFGWQRQVHYRRENC